MILKQICKVGSFEHGNHSTSGAAGAEHLAGEAFGGVSWTGTVAEWRRPRDRPRCTGKWLGGAPPDASPARFSAPAAPICYDSLVKTINFAKLL